MADVGAFTRAIELERELREALVHHEVLAEVPAQFDSGLLEGFDTLRPLLEKQNISSLYTHQSRAIRLIEGGHNVVLATPTASGKTLVYNLPVIRRALANANARALYLFPLKALEWDQRRRLELDLERVGALDIRVAIYDGDTPNNQRRKLRENPPQILFTTPDMLHE